VMSLLYAGGYFSRKCIEISKDLNQIDISIKINHFLEKKLILQD